MAISAANTMISIREVTKAFGPVRAVNHVSFDIAQGEFFSLLGASGCGKTTLLRMLAGFETPTEGEIFIDNQPMSAVAPNHRPTNMVFQSYAIFPHLNVRDNIAYGLVRKNLPKAELTAIVDRALDMIKLSGYGNRMANQLSGGQRQRVALARALVCQPKVLLLDEPLGALDKKLREEMQLELRQIQREVGITFVFVTHDQEEALTMSDRIAVMSKGEVLQIDSAAALYEHPNCREVAEFIGTMNVFEGRLLTVSGGIAQVDAGPAGRLLAPVGSSAAPAPGAAVSVAVRPEKLELSAAQPGAGNAIAGRRQAEAYLGDRSHYYVQAEGLPKPIAAAAQNTRRSGGGSQAGEPVWVHWPVEAGVLLTR
jgi:spermidine/putrescine ABC transporter ATP-binding subunit